MMSVNLNRCRRDFVKCTLFLCAAFLRVSLQAEDKQKPAEPVATPDFSGSWNFQTKSSGFGFDLVQTGDKIGGYHNSVVGVWTRC